MDGWMVGRKIDGWIDGWEGGWMEGRKKDGWIERKMNG